MTEDTVSEDVKLLEPCPFCGGQEHETAYSDAGWQIQCHAWTCRSATGIHQSEAEAIAAWNRRAYLAATKPPLAQEFEAWKSRARNAGAEVNETPFGTVTTFRHMDELVAFALASPPMPGRGEGFVLVPVEPTEEMLQAGLRELQENLGDMSVIVRDPLFCYRAMLAASRPKEDTHAK